MELLNLTELSPAAQAILDAYQFAPIEDELTAAAVVRAVADQCTYVTRTELNLIADELEAFV